MIAYAADALDVLVYVLVVVILAAIALAIIHRI